MSRDNCLSFNTFLQSVLLASSAITPFILTLTIAVCNAFETTTHDLLNRNAAQISHVDSYLKTQLSIEKGLNHEINNLLLLDIIGLSGRFEDNRLRFFNHFHNPLQPWNQAGLDSFWCTLFLADCESSILWGQRPVGAQDSDGNWSWHDARKYYVEALTNPSAETRGMRLADTFRAVGQLMHLIEDTAVPAHVRNDAHPPIISGFHFENWAVNNHAAFPTEVVFFDQQLLEFPVNSRAPLPIARIIDSGQYSLTSGAAITTSPTIGLAEYTNANFYSKDTIDPSSFPFPGSLTQYPIKIEERTYTSGLKKGETFNRIYYVKKTNGETNNGQGYVVAAADRFKTIREQYPDLVVSLEPIPILDQDVYKTYAQLLIPRAIGYSAGLLNYFFRPIVTVYGPTTPIPDPAPKELAVQLSSSEAFLLANHTGEDLYGTLELYYDSIDGSRRVVQNASWSIALNDGESMQPGSELTFVLPADAGEPGAYVLVFEGTMGLEPGAVFGRVINLAPPFETWAGFRAVPVDFPIGTQNERFYTSQHYWGVGFRQSEQDIQTNSAIGVDTPLIEVVPTIDITENDGFGPKLLRCSACDLWYFAEDDVGPFEGKVFEITDQSVIALPVFARLLDPNQQPLDLHLGQVAFYFWSSSNGTSYVQIIQASFFVLELLNGHVFVFRPMETLHQAYPTITTPWYLASVQIHTSSWGGQRCLFSGTLCGASATHPYTLTPYVDTYVGTIDLAPATLAPRPAKLTLPVYSPASR